MQLCSFKKQGRKSVVNFVLHYTGSQKGRCDLEMVCACCMYANTDMVIICNPCDRYSRENVQAGSK